MFVVNLFLIGLGTTEIMLIVAALFLLFGASRLPQLAKSLGQSRKAFKEGMREAEEEFELEKDGKMLNSKIAAPQISNVDDETLFEEARRRAAMKRES
ncbi:MAG TPA: twin-arginine translocase TatA/TatE family subunit [Pyrinomonadaceae bacterium]|nr:twin-arginine translocase TatA/TatE family subunit [Pyrinomonadaceae bacterium]